MNTRMGFPCPFQSEVIDSIKQTQEYEDESAKFRANQDRLLLRRDKSDGQLAWSRLGYVRLLFYAV